MNQASIKAVEDACMAAELAHHQYVVLPVLTFHPDDIGSDANDWAILHEKDDDRERSWVAPLRRVRAHLERLRA